MGICVSKESLDRMLSIAHSMPSWCEKKEIKVDTTLAEKLLISWSNVMSGRTPPYLEAKEKKPELTPLVYFYETFYDMLFSLAPEVKPMYTRKMSSQGRMLANVIKFIVKQMEEEDQGIFVKTMEELAVVHNVRGVTADQYSTLGMVLVHTMRECCGPIMFDDDLRRAWVLVYSRMMQVIIPVVVAGWKEDSPEWIKRKEEHDARYLALRGSTGKVAPMPGRPVYKDDEGDGKLDSSHRAESSHHAASSQKHSSHRVESSTHATTPAASTGSAPAAAPAPAADPAPEVAVASA